MLEVRNLSVNYGQHQALAQVSLTVAPGEIVAILGANGAGKSTLLRAIAGICSGRSSGNVTMALAPILGLSSDRIVEQGIALVPEGRGIFGDLTVRENLMLGAYANRARDQERVNFDRVIGLFPKLAERLSQTARTMSGGEQQMVAIGRAMMSNPRVLMLDEPSLGLSPLLCKDLFRSLSQVQKTGIGILLVEQNAKQSLAIADRGYLLENAHIMHQDSAANLACDPMVQKAYLGVAAPAPAALSSTLPSVPATATDAAAIAAAALAGFAATSRQSTADVPPVPLARPAPSSAPSADALIGMSVADLVARTARQSARPATKTATTQPVSVASHDDRLRAVLNEIENAAAQARGQGQTRRAETTSIRKGY